MHHTPTDAQLSALRASASTTRARPPPVRDLLPLEFARGARRLVFSQRFARLSATPARTPATPAFIISQPLQFEFAPLKRLELAHLIPARPAIPATTPAFPTTTPAIPAYPGCIHTSWGAPVPLSGISSFTTALLMLYCCFTYQLGGPAPSSGIYLYIYAARHEACQHTSAYVSIRQHTSAYVSIRQHTSAYVSLRQLKSTFVSIRQHTSAYVSIRQLTSAS